VATVELRNLTKRYGDNAVVDRVSLNIEHGKLVCLLGPSGCGKTTTLRLIAGFVEPTEGEILVGERVVSSPANPRIPTSTGHVSATPAISHSGRVIRRRR
jgi:iron(III) transport system ATP-binding protein